MRAATAAAIRYFFILDFAFCLFDRPFMVPIESTTKKKTRTEVEIFRMGNSNNLAGGWGDS